jgi:TolB-like protein/Tfp pilus assembly protein PilF
MTDALRDRLQSTLGESFRIDRELGGGGMSRVFVATETSLGREVVVKVLSQTLVAAGSCDRFAREVLLAARLQHPNIVPVLAAGRGTGVPYYTMPFVRGESLRTRMEPGRPMPVPAAIGILRDVARALAYAHGEGVVHRDIKPENVLLSGGLAVVTDFGIAKAVSEARAGGQSHSGFALTEEGSSLGTPAYMAPEQVTGDRTLDQRADLYAWGIMAWEMLVGRHPFHGRATSTAMLTAHMTELPAELADVRPELPRPLADIVMACIEKDPADRPASAQAVLEALDDVQLSRDVSTAPTTTLPVPRRRTRRIAIAVAAVLLVVLGVRALLMRRAPAADAAPTSLAVLPFESMGGDTANTYFAEGVADELTTALSRMPGLRLAGRRSAARFAGTTASAQEIGKSLDVGAVLEGSVRRADQRIRVTAELTNAADGNVLWSETFESDAQDVFAVQDDIARAIVGALRVRLGGTAPQATAVRGTEDLEAYDYYLRGLHFYRRRNTSVAQARAYLECAIARDPNFARAHAALASTLLVTPYFVPVHVSDVLPAARAAAEAALRLAPDDPASHVAMGFLLAESYRWADAEAEYRRAIALDPSDAETFYRLGNMLLTMGRTADAIPVLEQSKALDPMYVYPAAYLTAAYSLSDRPADAIREGERALELESNSLTPLGILASAHFRAGRPAEAVALARRMLAVTDNPRRLGSAAAVLGSAGQRKEAEAVVRRLEALPSDVAGRAAALTYAYAALGDSTRALEQLERAAAGDGDLLFAFLWQLYPGMDAIRHSPRFIAAAERYGLDVRSPPDAARP